MPLARLASDLPNCGAPCDRKKPRLSSIKARRNFPARAALDFRWLVEGRRGKVSAAADRSCHGTTPAADREQRAEEPRLRKGQGRSAENQSRRFKLPSGYRLLASREAVGCRESSRP